MWFFIQQLHAEDANHRKQRRGQVLPADPLLSTGEATQEDKFQGNLLNTIGVDFVLAAALRRRSS
jgi:hypothetical protein